MLKTGNMDYAWEYLSVAIQHELKYLTLDDHINLGNYQFDDFYKQAQVKVTGKKPGDVDHPHRPVGNLWNHPCQGCPQSHRGDPVS